MSVNNYSDYYVQSFEGGKMPKQYFTLEGQQWFAFKNRQTVHAILGMSDPYTGITLSTPLTNPNRRTKSELAWGMARHSRAPGAHWQIMSDIQKQISDKGFNPDQKMQQTFSGYGHGSVADGARIEVHHHNVPMHLAHTLFSLGSINSGQEKSTRYQLSFGDSRLSDIKRYFQGKDIDSEVLATIESYYQSLGRLSLENYSEILPQVTDAFNEFFKPENKKEASSLNSRVLDCVRYFLLMGHSTGFVYETSAREWSKIIAMLRASHSPVLKAYAEQLYTFLVTPEDVEETLEVKAEAPGLIRHSEADLQVNTNMFRLKKYLDSLQFTSCVSINTRFRNLEANEVNFIGAERTVGEKLIAQFIITLYPGVRVDSLFNWIRSLSDDEATIISNIVFEGHDHHEEMPVWAGVTEQTFYLTTDTGAKRDLLRHRAHARFSFNQSAYGLPIDSYTAEQILAAGFTIPDYLLEIPNLEPIKRSFIERMEKMYAVIYELFNYVRTNLGDTVSYEFIFDLLPLAHIESYFMHSNPKQASYITNLREAPGGLISYRILAAKMAKKIKDSDRFLSGITELEVPHSSNRKEFFDRS
jgi:thymidylate synthase ThyX